MDYKVTSKAIAVAETVFDGFDEQPVDCDFVLPDYYPDIAAVLKCTLKPVIQSRQLSGDRVIVDGTVTVHILYLDEARRCVRYCEIARPFTSNFTVKADAVNPVFRVTAKAEYVNCRAVSPRRLDIHGAFTVRLKMQAEGGGEVVCDIAGDTVHTRRDTVAYSVPVVSAEKSFTISEVLELGASQPAAESLVRGDAVPVLSDCKLLANKAIIKGELMLSNLYISDMTTGETQNTRHEIPFSQIVDIEGLDEEWQCDIQLSVVSSDIHISANQSGEGRLLEVNFKLMATTQCYRTDMAEIVTDAYSTRYPLQLETKRLDTEHLRDIQRDVSTVREAFDMPPDGSAGIVDIWCEAASLAQRCEEGRSVIDGRLMIFMLAKNNDGIVSYFERPADFQLEYEDNCTAVSADLTVIHVDYGMTGSNQVEIRAQIEAVRRCFTGNSVMAVESVTADESASYPEEKAALKIYYANSGESLWEVAKACHTSMDAVMEENALDGDVLTKDTMLLVPLC